MSCKPKIAVCSFAINDWYIYVVKYAIKVLKNYCEKYSYDFYFPNITGTQKMNRPIPWYKIPVILSILRNYDFVLWVDIDGFVDISKPLNNFIERLGNKHMLCSKDWNNVLNTGIMLFRNSPFCHALLNLTWTNKQEFDPNFHEQASMGQIYANNRLSSQTFIEILDFNERNSLYCYWGEYIPNNSFFVHIARCIHDPNGFITTMDIYCPIKMDEETEENFVERKEWLMNHNKSHTDILGWIDGTKIPQPSARIFK